MANDRDYPIADIYNDIYDPVAHKINVAATIGSVTTTENLAQVNGATVNVGVGASGTGTQRVAMSSDSVVSAKILDGSGNVISSTSNALDVNVKNASTTSTIGDLSLTYESIDASADVTDVTLIPATASKKGYLYYINIQIGSACDIALKDGSTALMGAQTVIANQVYTDANLISNTPLAKTSTNTALKLSRSSSTTVKGYVAYLLV